MFEIQAQRAVSLNFFTQLYLGNSVHKSHHVLLSNKNYTILESSAILRRQECALIVTRTHKFHPCSVGKPSVRCLFLHSYMTRNSFFLDIMGIHH